MKRGHAYNGTARLGGIMVLVDDRFDPWGFSGALPVS